MSENLKIQRELSDALKTMAETLAEYQIFYVQQQDEIDPNFWTCAAKDHDGYLNTGFVAWDKEHNRVVFYAYDPLRANHDDAEGVAPEDSKCFWDTQNVENFILHLTGEVREIVKKHRETISQKILDK